MMSTAVLNIDDINIFLKIEGTIISNNTQRIYTHMLRYIYVRISMK